MPTQIPVRAGRSLAPTAMDVFMLSLLAAILDGVIIFTIIWAYS